MPLCRSAVRHRRIPKEGVGADSESRDRSLQRRVKTRPPTQHRRAGLTRRTAVSSPVFDEENCIPVGLISTIVLLQRWLGHRANVL
jgi:hypothetical protein